MRTGPDPAAFPRMSGTGDLTDAERREVIAILYGEAARSDASMWSGPRGEEIREIISRMESGEKDIKVYYDSEDRVGMVTAGRLRAVIEREGDTS